MMRRRTVLCTPQRCSAELHGTLWALRSGPDWPMRSRGPPFTLLHTHQRICTHRPPLIIGAGKQVTSRSSCSVCVILNRQHFQGNTCKRLIMSEHLHMRWPDYIDRTAVSVYRNALFKSNESLVTECRNLIFKYSEDLKVCYP